MFKTLAVLLVLVPTQSWAIQAPDPANCTIFLESANAMVAQDILFKLRDNHDAISSSSDISFRIRRIVEPAQLTEAEILQAKKLNELELRAEELTREAINGFEHRVEYDIHVAREESVREEILLTRSLILKAQKVAHMIIRQHEFDFIVILPGSGSELNRYAAKAHHATAAIVTIDGSVGTSHLKYKNLQFGDNPRREMSQLILLANSVLTRGLTSVEHGLIAKLK